MGKYIKREIFHHSATMASIKFYVDPAEYNSETGKVALENAINEEIAKVKKGYLIYYPDQSYLTATLAFEK